MMLYAAGSVRDVSVDAECLSGLTWSGGLLWFAFGLIVSLIVALYNAWVLLVEIVR